MKKLFCLILLCVSSNMMGMGFFNKYFFAEPESEPVNMAVPPTVALFYLNEEIDFKKTMMDLVAIAKDKSIHGILLIIDSSGGSATKFGTLYDLVKRITQIKPVIILIEGVAMSGGYLLATAGDYIIAHQGSEIGSIGCL